jgi:hypothetical protein
VNDTEENNMKHAILVGIAVVGLAASGYAQAQKGQQAARQSGQAGQAAACSHFVDANGDGVCDNAGTRQGRRGPGMRGRAMRGGAGMAFGRGGQSLVDITAQVTGQERAAVVASLREGKTFAQVAEAAGKSADDLKQAALTARKVTLDEAVAAGRLTAKEAEAMITLMDARIGRQLTAARQGGRRPGAGRGPAAR